MATTDTGAPVDDETLSPEFDRVKRHITQGVAAAPRLTAEQAAELRALFAPLAR